MKLSNASQSKVKFEIKMISFFGTRSHSKTKERHAFKAEKPQLMRRLFRLTCLSSQNYSNVVVT